MVYSSQLLELPFGIKTCLGGTSIGDSDGIEKNTSRHNDGWRWLVSFLDRLAIFPAKLGGWLFQIFLLFSPQIIWGFMIQFDDHIFQMGWEKNTHRLANVLFVILKCWSFFVGKTLPLKNSNPSCPVFNLAM